MPLMEIHTEGTGGHYSEVLRRRKLIHMPEDVPIRVETLDGGMASGKPSVAFIMELPAMGITVLAQTSVKLFQLAAVATYARYGDQTGDAVMGSLIGGKAELTFSTLERCPGCNREIPGSCKFCPECGTRL